MKNRSPFTQRYDQLPDTLPIFPLASAVVLPGAELPLNIFEPRYLNMVQDAMHTHRLVGMIQPSDDSSVPALQAVGCAGRITRYAETSDGRLEIVLSGVCRFRITGELDTVRGYRLVVPDWQGYEQDLEDHELSAGKDAEFKLALRRYFERHDMQADWDMLDKLGAEALSGSLVGALDLGSADKQVLLEAETLEDRLNIFGAILDSEVDAAEQRH